MENDLTSKVFFSYIIPTIGRASLDRAVQSVLTQHVSHADFEIIVVNDSGNPLPAVDWMVSPRVTIIHTNKCERSFARNSGAAVARGRYLAFLDDDDWILPGALENFWQLANQFPNAAWLYGGIRIVDEHHSTLAEINSGLNGNCFAQIMGGAWAPIQSSMVQARAFFDSGGFNPLMPVNQDEDLCRRIVYSGKIANTPNMIACLYRGQVWQTTTNYRQGAGAIKNSRDLILYQPMVFNRLISSADSSYWYGRILRVYLSTIPWNIRQKRFFTALSRIFYTLAFFIRSIRHALSVEYWQGVKADHVPQSLHFVIKEYEEKISTARSAAG